VGVLILARRGAGRERENRYKYEFSTYHVLEGFVEWNIGRRAAVTDCGNSSENLSKSASIAITPSTRLPIVGPLSQPPQRISKSTIP